MSDLESLYSKLANAKDCKSLLKKYLTPALKDSLKDKKTSKNGTLADCIRSGCEQLDSGTGLYASDPEAYDVFGELFRLLIRDYHAIPAHQSLSHPANDFGDMDNLGFDNLDPGTNMVKSTRVRVGRSLQGFAFPPVLAKQDRLVMEEKVVAALNSLQGELAGTYYPLKGMDAATQKQLTEDHFLFNDHDRFLRSAGGYNEWPEGRGIFFSKDKRFLVWANEEDHMRIISMQQGGNLAEVYRRLVNAVRTLEKSLPFSHHKDFGYLTFCPTNLGTTLRASVHAAIPKLAKLEKFKDICAQLHIQPRGIHGEHTESVGGVYDLSNKRRMGLTEFQAISEMARGVKLLLLIESSL